MGRPSEYSPRFLEAARQYLINYRALGQVVPTKQGLARALGYNTKTMEVWAGNQKEFADVLDDLKDDQCVVLYNGALKGELNAVIAKLGLSTHHGMVEKSATDLTTAGQPLMILSHIPHANNRDPVQTTEASGGNSPEP